MEPLTEIPCDACRQSVQLDRAACPYCHAPLKSYWYSDANHIKQAVSFNERGKVYLVIDWQKVAADSPALPHGLRPFFPLSDALPVKTNMGERTRAFLTNHMMSPVQLPSQWNDWLNSEDIKGDEGISSNSPLVQTQRNLVRCYNNRLLPSPPPPQLQQMTPKTRMFFWIILALIILNDIWKHLHG